MAAKRDLKLSLTVQQSKTVRESWPEILKWMHTSGIEFGVSWKPTGALALHFTAHHYRDRFKKMWVIG